MGNKLGPTCCPSNETILDMIMLQLFRCFPKMWPTGDSKVGYSSALLAPINFTYVFFVVVVVVFHEHIDTTSLIEEFYYFSFSLVLERERNKEIQFHAVWLSFWRYYFGKEIFFLGGKPIIVKLFFQQGVSFIRLFSWKPGDLDPSFFIVGVWVFDRLTRKSIGYK